MPSDSESPIATGPTSTQNEGPPIQSCKKDDTDTHAVADPSTFPAISTPAARKLRIFMSYGHDVYEELAIRLDADLRARGHHVWFDKRELLTGTEWSQEIEKGINWVSEGGELGWVLLLMTPHSVRRSPEADILGVSVVERGYRDSYH